MCVKKKHSYLNYVHDLPFLRLSLLSVFAPAFLGTDSTSFSEKKKKILNGRTCIKSANLQAVY